MAMIDHTNRLDKEMAIKNVKMILKKTRDKTQKCINALHQ